MQEGDNGDGVGLVIRRNPADLELLQKAVVDVEGMLEKVGFVGAVETGGSRGREKVG